MLICEHIVTVRGVSPLTPGCEECLKEGRDEWRELWMCLACGHVGCCDDSRGRHATKHFLSLHHPIIKPMDANAEWAWCYVDDDFIDVQTVAVAYGERVLG